MSCGSLMQISLTGSLPIRHGNLLRDTLFPAYGPCLKFTVANREDIEDFVAAGRVPFRERITRTIPAPTSSRVTSKPISQPEIPRSAGGGGSSWSNAPD